MDAPKAAVRMSVVVAVGAAGLLVWLAAADSPAHASPVLAKNGTPFVVPPEAGVYTTQWGKHPVLVVVTTMDRLDAVDAARGEGSATPHLPIGEGLAVFALSAKSTHLGCTVGFNGGLGASIDIADYDGDGVNDGRIMDPCHHTQWDAFHRGTLQRGPGDGDLAVLDISLRDGRLYGAGFDGPTGPQR